LLFGFDEAYGKRGVPERTVSETTLAVRNPAERRCFGVKSLHALARLAVGAVKELPLRNGAAFSERIFRALLSRFRTCAPYALTSKLEWSKRI
jgi:hypothetical protein